METKRLAIGSQISTVQIGAAKEVEASSESVFDKVVFISAADIREFLFAAEMKNPRGGGLLFKSLTHNLCQTFALLHVFCQSLFQGD